MSEITLYVYDLSQGMAKQLSQSFLGIQIDAIYHTGIVAFDYEYFFGGGVQRMAPGMTPYGSPIEKMVLGKTTKTREEFESLIKKLGHSKFKPENYNLMENNCNNFTNDCSEFLLGKSIPENIIGLPKKFFATPIGQMMRGYFDQMMGGAHPTSGSYTDFSNDEVVVERFADPLEIYTFHKASLTQVLKKIKAVTANILTDSEFETLSAFVNDPIGKIAQVGQVCGLLVKSFEKVEEKDQFCLLDVVRLIICEPRVLIHFEKDPLGEYVFSMIGKKPSMPSQLMLLRILCNHFQVDGKLSYSVSSLMKRLDFIVDFITECLNSPTEGIRMTSASLICNLSLFSKDLGDGETQLICSIIEYANKEKNPDVVFRLLLALTRFYKNVPSARDLANSLEFKYTNTVTSDSIEKIKLLL